MIYELLRDLKHRNFPGRKLINYAFYDPDTVMLHPSNFDYVGVGDCKWTMTDQVDSVMRVEGNPWFGSIRDTDTVLDIGANCGAITIPLAMKARHVFAVEPLFGDLIRANIKLNELKNVTVLDYALGKDNTMINVAFSSRRNFARCMSFATMKELAGGQIDWLKVDCEGAEWEFIKPSDCEGIRELRFEFHVRRGKTMLKDKAKLVEWETWLTANNYEYDVKHGTQPGPCVPFCDCTLIRASLREKCNK